MDGEKAGLEIGKLLLFSYKYFANEKGGYSSMSNCCGVP